MCTVKLVFLLLSLSAPLLGPFSDCHSLSLLSGDQCEKNEQINKLNESIREYHFNFQIANYGSSFFPFSFTFCLVFCLFVVSSRERDEANSEFTEASTDGNSITGRCQLVLSLALSLPDSSSTPSSSIAHSANLHVVWLVLGVTLY